LAVAPDGTLWAATLHAGVFTCKDGIWLKLSGIAALDDRQKELTDLEIADTGDVLICLDDRVIKYTPRRAQPIPLIDDVRSRGQSLLGDFDGLTLDLSQKFFIEEGHSLDLRFSTWEHSRLAAYRHRVGDSGDWQYGFNPDTEISIPVPELGSQVVQLQFIDRDHNYSTPISLSTQVYLPWHRWRLPYILAATLLGLVFVASGMAWVQRSRAAKAIARRLDVEQAARIAAEEAVSERERLLQRVSHDLRNPMSVIMSCTDMIRTDNIPQEKALDIIDSTMDSMAYLTKQLISYSHAMQTAVDRDSRRTHVPSLLQAICNEMAVLVRNKDVSIGVELKVPATALHLTMPTDTVREVLQNLVSNAVKNTAQGEVNVIYSIVDHCPVLTVKDTGCGMSEEFLSRAFEPFVTQGQAANEASDSVGSFGLGLFIVKSLVDDLDGVLQADSALGKGTSISIRFPSRWLTHAPAADADAEVPKRLPIIGLRTGKPKRQTATPKHAPIQCLVVDDLEYVRQVVVRRLELEGITTAHCDSTNIPKLDRAPVLLTDLEMPGKTGFQVAEEFTQRFPGCRVIAFSEREELLQKARQDPHFAAALPKSDVVSNEASAIQTIKQQIEEADAVTH
jgi:signal transduction histidine kinase